MYEIDLNLPKQIVADVLSNHEIHSVAFVGCGASMSDLYPAKYFLANNTDKLNVQIFTANEFNYDTPSWVNEHTFVITCSLGGSTPETVEANKTAKKHNCPVVSLTNKAGSALTVDADYVIVHGFHANFAAKCEKPGYAIALAVEILQQTEGYDHYEEEVRRGLQGRQDDLLHGFRCLREDGLFSRRLPVHRDAVDRRRRLQHR